MDIPTAPPFWRDSRFIGFMVIVISSAVKRWGWKVDDSLNNEFTWVLTAVLTYIFGPGLFAVGQYLSEIRKSKTAVALAERGIPTTGSPTPPSSSTGFLVPLVLTASLLAGLTGLSGCSSVERVKYQNFRDQLENRTSKVRKEHKAWAEALATDPTKLPNLWDNETPEDRAGWLKAREGWHEDFDAFIRSSKEQDVPASQPFNPFGN